MIRQTFPRSNNKADSKVLTQRVFFCYRRNANHEKMAAALKRLRDALELQQFIQDAEDVSSFDSLYVDLCFPKII